MSSGTSATGTSGHHRTPRFAATRATPRATAHATQSDSEGSVFRSWTQAQRRAESDKTTSQTWQGRDCRNNAADGVWDPCENPVSSPAQKMLSEHAASVKNGDAAFKANVLRRNPPSENSNSFGVVLYKIGSTYVFGRATFVSSNGNSRNPSPRIELMTHGFLMPTAVEHPS